ncbi:PTS sugar transporter subunit IIA [bacterium]|nr:PTS sugar transporter subunit IIA [bacterium]
MKKEAVSICNDSPDKETALYMIIDLVCTTYNISFTEEITSAIMERENKLSTGIGLGIAVPHCRNDRLKTAVSAAILFPSGIEYNSVDGQPVRLVILIISPTDDVRGHIACLSSISHAVSDEDTRQKLINSSSADRLYEYLVSIE